MYDDTSKVPAVSAQPEQTDTLPLSCGQAETFRARVVPMKNGKVFLSFADVPASMALDEVVERVKSLNKKGVVLHSCDRATAEALAPKRDRLLVSYSAEIRIRGYKMPQKARNLCRRGAKECDVFEAAITAENAERFDAIEEARRAPGSPKIEGVFRTRFIDAHRAYVATLKTTGEWTAVITLTRYGQGRWHVEQLARHPEAPVGVMEQLIGHAVEKLGAEGAEVLNLGGVPLSYPEHDGKVVGIERFSLRDHAVRGISGALGNIAARRYNIKGLHQFKAKFNPHWEPRYLVGTRGLSLHDVYLMSKATGITGLTR